MPTWVLVPAEPVSESSDLSSRTFLERRNNLALLRKTRRHSRNEASRQFSILRSMECRIERNQGKLSAHGSSNVQRRELRKRAKETVALTVIRITEGIVQRVT